jgi:hypothetical protein
MANRLARSIAKALRPAAINKALTASPRTRPTGVTQFDAGMEVRPVSPLTSGRNWLRRTLLVHAGETEAPEEGHQPSRPDQKRCKSAASEVEPAGIGPATSCLQRNPPARAQWHDLLGIHPSGPRTGRAKARFVSRDFAGRWSTEVGAWTSSAAWWPRVLLGATDAPRR